MQLSVRDGRHNYVQELIDVSIIRSCSHRGKVESTPEVNHEFSDRRVNWLPIMWYFSVRNYQKQNHLVGDSSGSEDASCADCLKKWCCLYIYYEMYRVTTKEQEVVMYYVLMGKHVFFWNWLITFNGRRILFGKKVSC